MAINNIKSGSIIIAGSGMCNGGHIIHHLKLNISHEGAQVMIVDYQAYGTLGRKLVEGNPQVKVHDDMYPLRAKIHTVGSLPVHGESMTCCARLAIPTVTAVPALHQALTQDFNKGPEPNRSDIPHIHRYFRIELAVDSARILIAYIFRS